MASLYASSSRLMAASTSCSSVAVPWRPSSHRIHRSRPVAAAAATALELDSEDRWAIVRVAGVSQWVEVGRAIACSKDSFAQAALGNTVSFKEVLAVKEDGELFRGKPFLQDAVVEGIVQDEFQGPASSETHLTLQKVVITKIQQSSDSEDDVAMN